jgi:hypothetical protein
MLMERVAEVVRGWPYDGSLDRYEPIKTSSTLVNGDWVQKQSDNTVDKAGSTATAAAGLVIVGNGDSGSAAYAGKAVVLWGNFIANISNYAAGAYVPGSPLTVKNGVVNLGVPGTDPIVGYVLDVVASSSTQTAHLTIKVA